MQTMKVFKLGNSQAVRIPVRYRFDVDEVEVFQRDAELVLRPKAKTGADVFAAIRDKHGPLDITPPARDKAVPATPLDAQGGR